MPAVVLGIHHCRRGEWHAGLHYLLKVGPRDGDVTLPGLYYSYLGHALARCERQVEKGLELCEHAVAVDFVQPENFANLALVRLMARDRRGALEAVRRGLAVDPESRELRELAARFGTRRPPVLSWLPRGHALNRLLGTWRHSLLARA